MPRYTWIVEAIWNQQLQNQLKVAENVNMTVELALTLGSSHLRKRFPGQDTSPWKQRHLPAVCQPGKEDPFSAISQQGDASSWAELTCSCSLIFQGCWEISEAQDRKSYYWVILRALINMKQQILSGWSLKSINLSARMLPDFPSPSCRHLAEALGRWSFQLLPCCSTPSRFSWFLRAVLSTNLPGLWSYSWTQAASMPCGPAMLLPQS